MSRPAGSSLTGILVGALVAMLLVTGVLVAARARPSALDTNGKDAAAVQLTSQTARDAGLMAATGLTQNALSYQWSSLRADMAKAEAGMTPAFRKQYAETMAKVKSQTVKNQVVIEATVVAAGIVRATEHTFEALAFVNQTTRAKGTANTQLNQSRVKVTLTRADGDWRISRMDVY